MKIISYFLIFLCLLMITSCSRVTVKPEGAYKLSSQPTYEESLPFFVFKLIGEQHLNVKEICGDRDIKQIEAVDTFLDRLVSCLTLGIYTPRTVRVWCK
jgi:hypothetical protein